MDATRVIEITIETASAKISNTPSNENKNDRSLSYWAGEIPVKNVYEYPITDSKMKENSLIPKHVLDFYNKRKNGN